MRHGSSLIELNSALECSDRKVSEETEDIVLEFHESYRIYIRNSSRGRLHKVGQLLTREKAAVFSKCGVPTKEVVYGENMQRALSEIRLRARPLFN